MKLSRAQLARLNTYFMYSDGGMRASVLDKVDLDLLGMNLVKKGKRNSFGVSMEVTELGQQQLLLRRQAALLAHVEHDSLATRLAGYLQEQGRLTWENIVFRNYVKPGARASYKNQSGTAWVSCRPDVFSIHRSRNPERIHPWVHEVKVSRNDFINDLKRPNKRAGYELFSESVFYVSPSGIIAPEEVPEGYGLLTEFGPGEFEVVKPPVRRKTSLKPHHYLDLLYKRLNLSGVDDDEDALGL